MRIAIRGGHNFNATGARGIIDETTEDRKVLTATISYLQTEGHEVLDVTPGNVDVNTDLEYGVNKANSWNADLFISIHFNKAYERYNGNIGTEAWIYGTGGNAEPIANRIVNSISSKVGLINRGVKVSTSLYELRKTNMAAIIIEVCFVEATGDVAIYIDKGYKFVGKCIAEGILNKSIEAPTAVPVVAELVPTVKYQAQVQNVGWQGWKQNGETAGTEGQGLRLEALAIQYRGQGDIIAEGHIQNKGWQSIRHDGEVVGTVEEALRLEAIKISLEDKNYSIMYQVHVENIGWMDWVKDGEIAGTTGEGKRIEAIKIKIAKR